ncbi:hypothetical protein V8D89_010417 [Ganoderma adspersum]
MSNTPPSGPASSSRTEKTGTLRNAMQSLITSSKHTGSICSRILPRVSPLTDEERARPPRNSSDHPEGANSPAPGNSDNNCLLVLLLAMLWVLVALVIFVIAAIATITSVSLLLSLVGTTLLGLTRTSGEVYTNVTVVSLVVATVCGAAIITAAASALVLSFLPVSMCCGDDALSLTGAVAVFGCIVTTFFAPAIGIAVTNGHIISLRPEFTAAKAMTMNGVGLGGVLACVLAELILSGIIACLEAPEM